MGKWRSSNCFSPSTHIPLTPMQGSVAVILLIHQVIFRSFILAGLAMNQIPSIRLIAWRDV